MDSIGIDIDHFSFKNSNASLCFGLNSNSAPFFDKSYMGSAISEKSFMNFLKYEHKLRKL